MPTFKKAPKAVKEIADAIIAEHPEHESLREHDVRIDFMFAYPDLDDKTGEPVNDALTHHGQRALGIAKKLGSKDRAKGLGDCEITIDGHWWERQASEEQQRALIDHEICHFIATAKRDDLGRPKIVMRDNDFQFGWFTCIAQRHGVHSQERIQARTMVELSGQVYWPELMQSSGESRVAKVELRQRV